MPKPHPILRFSLWTLLTLLSGGLIIFTGALLYLSPKLPAVEKIHDIQLQIPLRVYTADGKLIAEFGEKKRTPITFDQIPPQFIQAILAAEDSRFYSHPGVDLKGLTRAVIELITTGSIKTGGSTITMQVAKNYFLTRERTFLRKFNEILLALQIERELTKNQILELYINKIYLGHRSYGIEAAANVYYGKPIHELALAQLAMVAGLPKAPSAYNPITNPERALARRNWILSRMLELNYIDQATFEVASSSPITAKLHGVQSEADASYLAEMARKEMLYRYGMEAYTAGYKTYTTINSGFQTAANKAVHKGLLEYDQRHGYRGPIGHYDFPEVDSVDAAMPLDDSLPFDNTTTAPTIPIGDILKPYRTFGPLLPGLVGDMDEEAAVIQLSQNSSIILSFEEAKWARTYIDVNHRGPEPKVMADILSKGDIIYIYHNNGKWRLGQLPVAQSALISMQPDNGAILALVGGFDYQASKFNRVNQAGRQAGSSFKPFIYAAALANGLTPATLINDAPVVFEDASLENTWRPENSSGKFFGPTRLRQALYKSRNLVSIRILRKIGIRNAINFAGELGFDTEKLPNNLSLALGSAALTPLEVATGYAILANGGYRIEPWFIARVEDNNGNLLFEARPKTACPACEEERERAEFLALEPQAEDNFDEIRYIENILDDETATEPAEDDTAESPLPEAPRVMDKRIHYIMHSMLQDVIKRGTGSKAKALNRKDLAGKTGTTNDQKDAWFSGFNRNVVTSVWTGFDAPETLGRNEFGATAALPIWMEYMRTALQGTPETRFTQPEGIVSVRIDPKTGKRAASNNGGAIFELFRAENTPPLETSSDSILNPYSEEETLPEQLF